MERIRKGSDLPKKELGSPSIHQKYSQIKLPHMSSALCWVSTRCARLKYMTWHACRAKLEHYGIRDVALQWIKSVFSYRRQFVQINQTCSSTQTIKCGVPQGSILGPLFFILYTNDLRRASKLIMWSKRTWTRPNWLDNCAWLGISSERLACCRKGTCHGFQSTVGSVQPPKWYWPRNDPQPWNDPQIDPEMIPTPKWSPLFFLSTPKWSPRNQRMVGTHGTVDCSVIRESKAILAYVVN